MGAKITGQGTHVIEIEGVEILHGYESAVISDYVEAGTFIVMAALTPGRVTIKNIDFNHLDLFLSKLEEIGTPVSRSTRPPGLDLICYQRNISLWLHYVQIPFHG